MPNIILTILLKNIFNTSNAHGGGGMVWPLPAAMYASGSFLHYHRANLQVQGQEARAKIGSHLSFEVQPADHQFCCGESVLSFTGYFICIMYALFVLNILHDQIRSAYIISIWVLSGISNARLKRVGSSFFRTLFAYRIIVCSLR